MVDFQAYNDYCNRHSANQESILEDAQALLSLAADPITSGTGSPFFVDDNVDPGQAIGGGVGVGLEISAAAALAAAQAARQPLPFSQFTTSSATTAQRPPLPRSATTSALLHNGGVPKPPYAAPTGNNGAAVITATQIEAYRSLAAQMGLDLNAAGGGSPDPYDGADQAFDSSAFEPVMESTMLPLPLPPAPLYYLPPPVPSTSAAATAETTRSASASASTATFFYPTLGPSSSSSQSSDPNAIANAAAQQRRRQDPEWLSEREARHRARFDRAAKEALTQQQQQDEEPVSQRANASGGLLRSQGYGYGYGRAHDHDNNNRDDDPMFPAPIETTRNLPPQQPPSLPSLPARRSSWLLSPVLDPLSLPVTPSACSSSSSMQQQQQQQQRPHLSIDAAGAFAQTFREASPLSGSGASGVGGGVGGGGAISALFWRGLPSAATPLRSAFAATAGGGGTTPLGTSKIRFWQDVVVDSPDRENDGDDDDDDDERFEPRPAGGNAAADHSLLMMMAGSGGGGGVLDEWERFQPRAANQTERTAADLTVVQEREPEEQEPGEQESEEQEQEEGGGDGGEEEPLKDGSAATGAEAEQKELVASGGSPQTSAAAAVSVGAMETEGPVEVTVAVDGGGSTTAATVGVGN